MTCTLRLRNKAFYIKNTVGITDYKPDASGGVHVAWGADYAAAWKGFGVGGLVDAMGTLGWKLPE